MCKKRTDNPALRAENVGTDTQSWYKICPLIGYTPTRVKPKSSHDTKKELTKVSGSIQKSFSLRNLWNLAKLVKKLSWSHCTTAPHRSETNGFDDRAVRRIQEGTSAIKEGTSAVLLQSGLDEKWWADSVECYFYLRNVEDSSGDGVVVDTRVDNDSGRIH